MTFDPSFRERQLQVPGLLAKTEAEPSNENILQLTADIGARHVLFSQVELRARVFALVFSGLRRSWVAAEKIRLLENLVNWLEQQDDSHPTFKDGNKCPWFIMKDLCIAFSDVRVNEPSLHKLWFLRIFHSVKPVTEIQFYVELFKPVLPTLRSLFSDTFPTTFVRGRFGVDVTLDLVRVLRYGYVIARIYYLEDEEQTAMRVAFKSCWLSHEYNESRLYCRRVSYWGAVTLIRAKLKTLLTTMLITTGNLPAASCQLCTSISEQRLNPGLFSLHKSTFRYLDLLSLFIHEVPLTTLERCLEDVIIPYHAIVDFMLFIVLRAYLRLKAGDTAGALTWFSYGEKYLKRIIPVEIVDSNVDAGKSLTYKFALSAIQACMEKVRLLE
jgi:hypothetical protein